ncbi:hypothetical protein M3J09_002780 [Ascochyta lentis]
MTIMLKTTSYHILVSKRQLYRQHSINYPSSLPWIQEPKKAATELMLSIFAVLRPPLQKHWPLYHILHVTVSNRIDIITSKLSPRDLLRPPKAPPSLRKAFPVFFDVRVVTR